MNGRQQLVARPLLWLSLALAACATRSYRVEQAFVPSLFGDLLAGTELGRDSVLKSRFGEAWALIVEGRLSEASRALDQLADAVEDPADRFPVEAARGVIELTAGDYRSGVATFDRALALKAGYAPALLGEAAGRHLLGDDESAYEWLERLRAVEPESRGGDRLRARVRDRLLSHTLEGAREAAARGDVAAELTALRRAVDLDPADLDVRLRFAHLALAAGDHSEALAAFRAVTAGRPDDADAWVGLGEASMKTGDAVSARAAFERAAELPGGLDSARERVEALRNLEQEVREQDPTIARLASAPSLDRASLATFLRARLPRIDRVPPREAPMVITDVARSWARRDIQDLVAAGIMDVYDNHTFRPDAQVNRIMLAQTVGRVLRIYRAAGWLVERSAPEPAVSDVPPEHVNYQDMADVLRYDVMALAPDGAFDPFGVVTGSDVTAVIDRLTELVR